MAVIYLDLSKAFDTISHDLLLKKLDIYGIRGICNKWFESYISIRELKVKCNTLSCSNSVISQKYRITHVLDERYLAGYAAGIQRR